MQLEIEGIVIRQVPYKEKDAMMTVFTPEGRVGFCARGIFSLASKNASSCLLYAHSSFSLTSRNDHLSLTRGTLLTSSYSFYESMEKMTALGLMSEILLLCVDEDDAELYPYFYQTIKAMEQDFSTVTLIAIYLAKVILQSGYQLSSDACALCGNQKKIVAVDYEAGGFICGKCATYQKVRSVEYLKSFRYVFMVPAEKLCHYKLKQEIAVTLIEEFLDYLCKTFDIQMLRSKELFLSSIPSATITDEK